MNLRTMLGDVWRSLWRKPVTQTYPFTPSTAPPRLRGALRFDPTDCTGCGLCVKDCPAAALDLTILDRKAKRFALQYHLDRCTFCAQCVVSCRFNCLELAAAAWELAGSDRSTFEVWHGKEADVQEVLAARTAAVAEPAAA